MVVISLDRKQMLLYIKNNASSKTNKELANDLDISVAYVIILKRILTIYTPIEKSPSRRDKIMFIKEHGNEMNCAELAKSLNCSEEAIKTLSEEIKLKDLVMKYLTRNLSKYINKNNGNTTVTNKKNIERS